MVRRGGERLVNGILSYKGEAGCGGLSFCRVTIQCTLQKKDFEYFHHKEMMFEAMCLP